MQTGKSVTVHADITVEQYNRLKSLTPDAVCFEGKPHEFLSLTAQVFIHGNDRKVVTIYDYDYDHSVMGDTLIRLEAS